MQITLPPTPSAHQDHAANPVEGLEQAFLEEMLKYCGPRAASDGFSGGVGEDQFGSFLTREYARIMARHLDLRFATLAQKVVQ